MLHKNLKSLREQKGITQTELGAVANASIKTVQNWESGKTEPKVSELILMAKKLGVSIAELVGEEETEQNRLLEKIKNAIGILSEAELQSLTIMIEGLYLRHQSHKAKQNFTL